jgi:hypothetical protein
MRGQLIAHRSSLDEGGYRLRPANALVVHDRLDIQ